MFDFTPGTVRDQSDWAGVLRPGRLLWLRAIAWAVLLIILTGLVAFPIGYAAHLLHVQRGSALSMVTLGTEIVAVVSVYVFVSGWGERRTVDELAVPHLVPGVAGGLAVGVVVFSIGMGALLAGGWYRLTGGPPGPPWHMLVISLGAGVLEELLFRGIIMRLLWEAFGLRVALGVSAVVFGLAHLANPGHDWVGPVYIVFEAGILLGGLYALTGRLWASIGAHAGWNFSQGYIFGAEVSGTDPGAHWLQAAPVPGAPALMTGGAFGPEASLACLLVATTAGVLVVVVAKRRRQAAAGWAVR